MNSNNIKGFDKFKETFNSVVGQYPNEDVEKSLASIFSKILDVIKQNHIEFNQDEVSYETLLQEDMGVDSLDAVEIMMSCEEVFEFVSDDTETADFKTIGDIVLYIYQKTSNN